MKSHFINKYVILDIKRHQGGEVVQTTLDSYIRTAIHGSEVYYQYLTEHQRGIVENQVARIQQGEKYIVLSLKSSLKFPENTQIKIENKIYTSEQIRPISYNEKTRELTVHALEMPKKDLLNTPVRRIRVISDLRFLVKRIRDWYDNNGAKICLPIKINYEVPMPLYPQGDKPSLEQERAIHSALSNPFSYIWGAPGTGKTQFVLARCILAYVQQGKRVWITAPTNNAVDQMLRGVLPVLEQANIPREKVLRLGVPSQSFYAEYPEVCMESKIVQKQSQLDDQLLQLKVQLAKNSEQSKLLKTYQRMLAFERAQNSWEAQMPLLVRQLTELYSISQSLEKDCFELHGRRILAEAKLKKLQKEEKSQQTLVTHLTKQVAHYEKGLCKWFCKTERTNVTETLRQEMKQLDAFRENIRNIDAELAEYFLQDIELRQEIENCKQRCEENFREIQRQTNYWRPLRKAAYRLNCNNIVSCITEIQSLTQKAHLLLEERRPKYGTCESLSEEKLHDQRVLLEKLQTKAQVEKNRIEASINDDKERLVLAATVDTCLQVLSPDNAHPPAHIFLDEAGYCAMIKGAALLAYHCPVTFLGDHMQLPPVCEMQDEEIAQSEFSDVCLWAQSALYAEDIFCQNPEQILQIYIHHLPARFDKMKKFDLTHTYRFGEKLASVLAQFVYSNDFHGNVQHSTEIYFLNATHIKTMQQKRISQTECDAISTYVHTHLDEQIGVITPYKNQRELLCKMMLRTTGQADNVFTVHGSQGREWDTVLLSVVDTTDKWFTDSERIESNGRKLINTAVSRAKKKLIIICDVNYWARQSTQLIHHLLDVATQYPL